jgi:iron-sulfur cluster assembly accessory protein
MEVTSKAAVELKSIMEKQKKGNCGLRIYLAGLTCRGPSFGLEFEEKAMEGDIVIESNGIALYLDQAIAETLKNAKLDYIITNLASGFIITNVNTPSCDSNCNNCR